MPIKVSRPNLNLNSWDIDQCAASSCSGFHLSNRRAGRESAVRIIEERKTTCLPRHRRNDLAAVVRFPTSCRQPDMALVRQEQMPPEPRAAKRPASAADLRCFALGAGRIVPSFIEAGDFADTSRVLAERYGPPVNLAAPGYALGHPLMLNGFVRLRTISEGAHDLH